MVADAGKSGGLEDGSRVIIVGGGPSGAFFAIHLLDRARKAGKQIRVTIADPKIETDSLGAFRASRGCNYCAGLISPRLDEGLRRQGIELPDGVVCQRVSHIWIHGQWKNFPFKVPKGARMVSVFRGTLPGGRSEDIDGLDGFLLKTALARGADLLRAKALDIACRSDGRPRLTLASPEGERFELAGDFCCICTGVDPGGSGLMDAFAAIQPGFVPPRTRRALIFELTPGRPYLKKYMDREVYIIVSASGAPDIDHAALVPKGDHLTVALTGRRIDRACFPGDFAGILRSFFALEGARQILPGLTPENTRVSCSCSPLMAVSPARFPYGPRIGLAGDAMGAKLYRDGLYSAFVLTRELARTLILEGVAPAHLGRTYETTLQWLHRDNIRSRQFMGLVRIALSSGFLSRVLYQTFATEMKFKPMDQWPVGRLLWQIGSGAGDFGPFFRTLASGPIIRSAATGMMKTLRNMGTEVFFGLNWAAYGRYPAVVIKEKRAYIKQAISRTLGISLAGKPGMERMYAVKIRASADAIFRELGRFGAPGSRFLKLRFVHVSRIFGAANQEGAVVRYAPAFLPIAMDVVLKRQIRNKALLYEPSPLFALNGRLIFHISPTRDGNNRLAVYTAFDYRKGNTLLTKCFWGAFKKGFPDFAHDVVWNHAICCIKGDAEMRDRGTKGRLVDENQGLVR